MPTFDYSFTVRASAVSVADFHRDTRVLQRLTPPPLFVQLHRVDPQAEGSISEFTLWFGPLPVRWQARHSEVDPLRGFTDTQLAGPLLRWRHTHTFIEFGAGLVRVDDHIVYEHHAGLRGWLSRLLFAPAALNFLFVYRELATRRGLERGTMPQAGGDRPGAGRGLSTGD